MADDNGVTLAHIQRLSDERAATLRRAQSKIKDYRHQAAELAKERDAALRERDEARAAAAQALRELDPSPYKLELDRLRAQVAEGEHRAVFEREARARGADDSTVDLVYKLSGYKAEGTPDPKAIGSLLDGLRDAPGTGRMFAVAQATPAAGSGQGARQALPGKYVVTQAQLRDGAWCMEHMSEMREARSNGTFVVLEE
jgi:hypothetical protein